MSQSIELRMRLTVPIIRSQTPPIWDAWGGLNIQVTFLSFSQLWISPSSTFTVSIFISFTDPTKFVPLSERNNFTFPKREINLRNAFVNADDDISGTTSICIALIVRHVNKIAHRLLLA
jgi:hypothetical protein